MATNRNNMFFAQGAIYACGEVLQILEEHPDDKDRIEAIQMLRSAWMEAMILNEEKEILHELHTD